MAARGEGALAARRVVGSHWESFVLSWWLGGPFVLTHGGSPLLVFGVGNCSSAAATKRVDCRGCVGIDATPRKGRAYGPGAEVDFCAR